MKYRFFFSLAAIALLFSCSNNSSNEKLKLNNGEKWVVIESMIVYIRNMETDVAAFQASANKDYPALSEKLQTNIGLLTANCTMKGEAHDQLHVWLLPNIELVKALTKTKMDKESDEVFNKIQNSYITFNQYFQ